MTGIWKHAAAKLGRLTGRRRPTPAPTNTARPRPDAAAGPGPRSGPVPRPDAAAGPGPRSGPVRAHAGRLLAYAPDLDGQADPGEIVWTWVAYEDDPRQGKDRPVLVVGRHGSTLLGLMLSSKQDRDGQRHWFALGPGAWDSQSRPSWVRLDRVLEVDETGIRREGAVLDRVRFDSVARALRAGYGWS